MSSLLFVGCGKMGSALLRGAATSAARIVVVEPAPLPERPAHPALTQVAAPESIPADFRPDLVVLAVKPQIMAEVLPRYASYAPCTFLSIAAGLTLAQLASFLGKGQDAAIVRAMPNLPACVGKGISVAIANAFVTSEGRALCDDLLQAAGGMTWIEEESLLNPVTALSGSGPAYVFALAEAMAAGGEALGLPPNLAAELARQTVIGSAELLAQSTATPAALRQAVTSKGGTTAAALELLLATDGGLAPLLTRAMAAANRRAKELET